MPTSFPRLSIVVTPEQHRLLTRLGALQGRSQASYVRHLLDLATPALRALLTPLERAMAEEEALDEGFQEALEQALQDADDELEAQLEFFDPLGIEAALDSPEMAGAGEPLQPAPAEPPEAALHPYSNTGVRDPGTGGADIVRFERRAL